MKCYIKGYDKCKYEADSQKIFQYDLNNVKGFKVHAGELDLPIKVDKKMEDDLHEYLIIYFEDGTKTVYQNSRVDLFKY